MDRPAAKTVLITGATGFLGQHLCDYFRGKGDAVRGLVRRPDAYPFAEPGIKLFHGTLPDQIDAAAFDGVDLLIHCAYTTRFTSLEEARRVNHLGTLKVHELAQSANVGQFVFVSSTGAHAQAESYYGRSKYALEAQMDPAKDLVIRPGFVVGPGEGGAFNRMKASLERLGIVPIFDGGRQVLQTIHVVDLCRAIDLATAKGLTGLLVVAEPQGVEMREFFELLARRLGRRCRFVPLPLAPTLGLLRIFQRLRVPFPLSSENLLGLKHMRHVPSADDLARIGLEVKTASQSIEASLAA